MYILNLAISYVAKKATLVTLISDVAMATSRARQGNGVVQRCVKGPRDVQNAARAAKMSAPIVTLKTEFVLFLFKVFMLTVCFFFNRTVYKFMQLSKV